MRQVNLGGKSTSVVGLGLWQFGSPEWGWGPDLGEAAAIEIVNRALDLGINLMDTAELYGDGKSEEILAKALGSRREEAIIATKVSPTHVTRSRVKQAADRSLSRLKIDTIDLYQVHWPNRFIRQKSTMTGMRELLESGKISEVGVSNYPLKLWQKSEDALGRPVIANQVEFHLLDRSPLQDLVPHAQRTGSVIIAYSPLAQGALGGRYDSGNLPADFRSSNPMFSKSGFETIAPLVDELRAVGEAHNATPAQIALAWLLHIPQVVVIPGARSVEQVEANASAADIELSDAEWTRLKETAEVVTPAASRRKLTRIAAWLLGAR